MAIVGITFRMIMLEAEPTAGVKMVCWASLTANVVSALRWQCGMVRIGNGLADAVEISERARKSGVRGVVGLQARSAPLINNVRDLVRDGYVGVALSTTLIGSVRGWGAETDRSSSYLVDARNGATLLTIPFGHTVDALCYCLGEFTELTATTATRRPIVRLSGTDETTNPIPLRDLWPLRLWPPLSTSDGIR
jgi:hypothetical protein